ncbi:DUF1048 domain-containing protein [Scrofimicrobium sp. R131]|uniref:DUF1048 domain-containing protein n=1 Tax=Scrofimicrobium appendicitidis TaxID=3079930 RepID=A0AAU7V4G5_9ACTO
MTNPLEFITGSWEGKRQWRAYRQRVEALPGPYRKAASAIERYLLHTGPTDTEPMMQMLTDLADLFEQAVADQTHLREVVGDDPVEFVETFKDNYGQGSWLAKERQRLRDAVEEQLQ